VLVLADGSKNPALLVAAITAAVAVTGWVVNYVLTGRSERRRREAEAQLKHSEKQLEELYGPLAFLVIEGRRTFADLLGALGRGFVFLKEEELYEDDLKTWLFWAENDLMPRNEKIQEILMAKTHLIEGNEMPEVYKAFLDHHNSWKINHLRWKTDGTKYGWHSRTGWPGDFEDDILSTFARLKARHAALLGETSGPTRNEDVEPPQPRDVAS
jgi:hypothetical protein